MDFVWNINEEGRLSFLTWVFWMKNYDVNFQQKIKLISEIENTRKILS